MKKLLWHQSLGHVILSLTFDNGEFEFKCLPIHAILISYFDDSKYDPANGVSSEFLAKEMKIPQQIVKQKMQFWIHKGVILEEKKNMSSKMFNQSNYFGEIPNENEASFYKTLNSYKFKEQMDESENYVPYEQDDEDNIEMIQRDQSLTGMESIQFIKDFVVAE